MSSQSCVHPCFGELPARPDEFARSAPADPGFGFISSIPMDHKVGILTTLLAGLVLGPSSQESVALVLCHRL